MGLQTKERWVMVAIVPWVLVSVLCVVLTALHAQVAGPAAARANWPIDSRITEIKGQPTLMVFLHPRCPCSAATLSELSRALGHFNGDAPAYVLFSIPKKADPSWDDTDLIDQAQAIPGVHVLFDADGAEATRFGVSTSGQVLLFDADRKCVFNGGITPARGHEGLTPGRTLIESVMVNHQPPSDILKSPVFGCSLYRARTDRIIP